ncbi:MAG TPA: hypothetical protein DD727_03895, partial [Clostridiales bacterium]|nr:hypothetical protein [Clostridiales bacterium]
MTGNFATGKLKPYMIILAGSVLSAAALSFFLIPYRIAPGGASGLATVLHYLTQGRLAVGTGIVLINLPLFLLGYRLIGRTFFYRSLFGMISLSLFTNLMSRWVEQNPDWIPDAATGAAPPDLLLYALLGGALTGVGIGLVLGVNASTGGSEMASRIIGTRMPWVSLGQILMLIDVLAVLTAALAFNSILLGLYALVSIFITSKTIDALLEGVNYARAVFVISVKTMEISREIMETIGRGATALKGV